MQNKNDKKTLNHNEFAWYISLVRRRVRAKLKENDAHLIFELKFSYYPAVRVMTLR